MIVGRRGPRARRNTRRSCQTSRGGALPPCRPRPAFLFRNRRRDSSFDSPEWVHTTRLQIEGGKGHFCFLNKDRFLSDETPKNRAAFQKGKITATSIQLPANQCVRHRKRCSESSRKLFCRNFGNAKREKKEKRRLGKRDHRFRLLRTSISYNSRSFHVQNRTNPSPVTLRACFFRRTELSSKHSLRAKAFWCVFLCFVDWRGAFQFVGRGPLGVGTVF